VTDVRDWPRYAKALDMRLEGKMLKEIAAEFNVSKQRAGQMVLLAKTQLAFRVFKGLPRPLPKPSWMNNKPCTTNEW
jgi:orotate phosphoribosyltransferase-like protein